VALMAAMLIIPGAAARFWTERLGTMVALSAVFGVLIGVAGGVASAQVERLPTGPVVVLAGTVLFLISVTLAPRRGVIARWWRAQRVARHVAVERLLLAMFDAESTASTNATPAGVAGARTRSATAQDERWHRRELAVARRAARFAGLIEPCQAGEQLTAAGRKRALEAARNTRLWQTLLTEYPELAVGVADPYGTAAADVIPDAIARRLQDVLISQGRWPEPLAEPSRRAS